MSTTRVDIDKWRGQRADVQMDPELIQFRARVADEDARDCAGCLFRDQHAQVCSKAALMARRAGIADCDDKDPKSGRSHIYVKVEVDTRQLQLADVGTEAHK